MKRFQDEYVGIQTEESIINKILFSSKSSERIVELNGVIYTTIEYVLDSGFTISATSVCSDINIFDVETSRAFAHAEAAKKLRLIRNYILSFKTGNSYEFESMSDELKLDPSINDSTNIPDPPFPMMTRSNIQSRLWWAR